MLCGRRSSSASFCVVNTCRVLSIVTIRGRALFGGQASTTHQPPSLLPPAEMLAKVKKEQFEHVFKQLKRKPAQIINLDSPYPLKQFCRGDAANAPQNPSTLPGLQVEEADFPEDDIDHFPARGEPDELQLALENIIDEEDESTS